MSNDYQTFNEEIRREQESIYNESKGYAREVKRKYENGEFITALEYNSFVNRSVPITEELGIKKRYSVVYNPRLKRVQRRRSSRRFIVMHNKEYCKRFREYEWEKYRQKRYYKIKPVSLDEINENEYNAPNEVLRILHDNAETNFKRRYKEKPKPQKKMSNEEYMRTHRLVRCHLQPINNSVHDSPENESSDDEVILEEFDLIQRNEQNKNTNEDVIVNTNGNINGNLNENTNQFLSNQNLNGQRGMEEDPNYEKTEEVDPLEKNRISVINDNEFNILCRKFRGLTSTITFEYNGDKYLYIDIHEKCIKRNGIEQVNFMILEFIKYVNIECDVYSTIISAYGSKHNEYLHEILLRFEIEGYHEKDIVDIINQGIISKEEMMNEQRMICKNIKCEYCSVHTLICDTILGGYYDCVQIECTSVTKNVQFSEHVRIIIVDEEYNGPREFLERVHKRHNKGEINEYYTKYE